MAEKGKTYKKFSNKKETPLRKAEVKAIKSGARSAKDSMTMNKKARGSSQLAREFNQGYISGKKEKAAASRAAKPATKKSAQKKTMSGKNSDALGVKNREAYIDAVQNIRETSETRKDVWDAVDLIAKAGKKYKQDPTRDIAKWKKFVKEVTPKDVNPKWKMK